MLDRSRAAIVSIAVALVACAARDTPEGAARTASGDTPAWVGTWAVAPQSGNATFGKQTIRQIVHTSIGGTSARIHVSNVFGDKPLAIADVHIAESAGGGAIAPGTDHAVTFGGQGS